MLKPGKVWAFWDRSVLGDPPSQASMALVLTMSTEAGRNGWDHLLPWHCSATSWEGQTGNVHQEFSMMIGQAS